MAMTPAEEADFRAKLSQLSSPDRFAVDPVSNTPLPLSATEAYNEKIKTGGGGGILDWLINGPKSENPFSKMFSSSDGDLKPANVMFPPVEGAPQTRGPSATGISSVPNMDPNRKDMGYIEDLISKQPETPPEASQSPADRLKEYMSMMGASGGQSAENPYAAQLDKVAKPQTKGQFLMALGAGMMGAPTFFEGVSTGMKAAMESGDKGKALYYDALNSLSGTWEKGEDRKAELEYRNKALGIDAYNAMNPETKPSTRASLLEKVTQDKIKTFVDHMSTWIETNPDASVEDQAIAKRQIQSSVGISDEVALAFGLGSEFDLTGE